VNGNVKLGHAAARSGEWAQHFLNASCLFYWEMTSFAFCTFMLCNIITELQGREERSKQYFDKVLNGIGGNETEELLNEVGTFVPLFLIAVCNRACVMVFFILISLRSFCQVMSFASSEFIMAFLQQNIISFLLMSTQH